MTCMETVPFLSIANYIITQVLRLFLLMLLKSIYRCNKHTTNEIHRSINLVRLSQEIASASLSSGS